MSTLPPPAELSSSLCDALLEQGRDRARTAAVIAHLVETVQRHASVEIETPDPAFDRAAVLRVRLDGDAWLVSVSLAGSYAFVLREDTSETELITPDSSGLDALETTVMQALHHHDLQVLSLADLQLPVACSDAAVTTMYELCFQEGGEPFWKFNWFVGQA
jgi:hypothetical protein